MHRIAATNDYPSPPRRSAAAHATTGYTATPEAMRLRRSTVEHPFANLKYRIFGHPRFLLRGLGGAQTEISLGVAAYNLKRMQNILGARRLTSTLQTV
jgi:Transposase DDE domain